MKQNNDDYAHWKKKKNFEEDHLLEYLQGLRLEKQPDLAFEALYDKPGRTISTKKCLLEMAGKKTKRSYFGYNIQLDSDVGTNPSKKKPALEAMINAKILLLFPHENLLNLEFMFYDPLLTLEYWSIFENKEFKILKNCAMRPKWSEKRAAFLLKEIVKVLVHLDSHHVYDYELSGNSVFLNRFGEVKLGLIDVAAELGHVDQIELFQYFQESAVEKIPALLVGIYEGFKFSDPDTIKNVKTDLEIEGEIETSPVFNQDHAFSPGFLDFIQCCSKPYSSSVIVKHPLLMTATSKQDFGDFITRFK